MQPVGRNHTISDDQLIDSSTGLPVPSDEPIFILRGNNPHSVQALRDYREACARDNCPEAYLKELDGILLSFSEYAFAHRDQMKKPGVPEAAPAPAAAPEVAAPSSGFRVSGVIEGPDLTGIEVSLVANIAGKAPVVATPNESGYFEFLNVEDGRYMVRADKAGVKFVPEQQWIRVHDDTQLDPFAMAVEKVA